MLSKLGGRQVTGGGRVVIETLRHIIKLGGREIIIALEGDRKLTLMLRTLLGLGEWINQGTVTQV